MTITVEKLIKLLQKEIQSIDRKSTTIKFYIKNKEYQIKEISKYEILNEINITLTQGESGLTPTIINETNKELSKILDRNIKNLFKINKQTKKGLKS
ncbi:MAG: hypothetical protein M0R17_05100 [Candidatus Omnitrophica bacterium]|jgi:hypothetical protein|nr:hypothetical protein [Candidatus Omnitrophota bacterium]